MLNRKFIRPQTSDPEEYSILKSKVDLLVSHVAFSENCIILRKKPFPVLRSDWNKVDRRYTSYGKVRKPSLFGRFFRGKDHQRTYELPRGKRGFVKTSWGWFLKTFL